MTFKTRKISVIWFVKYVLPLLALFFSYGFLGHLYTINLTKKDLINNSGVIENIKITTEYGGKLNYYYPLIITLQNHNYRLPDSFSDKFEFLKSKIAIGDTISIYSRSEYLTYIGWDKKDDIYCIEKNNKEIFQLQTMKDYKTNQMLIFLTISIILWGSFFYFRKKITLI